MMACLGHGSVWVTLMAFGRWDAALCSEAHILCVCSHLCFEGSDVNSPFHFHKGACLKHWAFMVWISSASVKIMFRMDRKTKVGNSELTIAKLGQREYLAHDSPLSCAVKVWSQQDYTEVKPAWLRGGSMSPFPAAFSPEAWWWFILMLFFTDAPHKVSFLCIFCDQINLPSYCQPFTDSNPWIILSFNALSLYRWTIKDFFAWRTCAANLNWFRKCFSRISLGSALNAVWKNI